MTWGVGESTVIWRSTSIYSGTGFAQQASALHRGMDVVVEIPGRIADHLQRGTLDLSKYLMHLMEC